MDGFHVFSGWALSINTDGYYTVSSHWECPPIPFAFVETMIVGTFEFDDRTTAQIGISSAQYIDDRGVPRTEDFPSPPSENSAYKTVIAYPNLVRFDWILQISDCEAHYIMNVYEWGASV